MSIDGFVGFLSYLSLFCIYLLCDVLSKLFLNLCKINFVFRILQEMPKSYVCPECQKLFVRKSSRDKHHLFRHRETTKSQTRTPLNQSFQCLFCENEVSSFKSKKDLVSHIDASHLENLKYSLHKSALNGKIKFYQKHIFSKETLN